MKFPTLVLFVAVADLSTATFHIPNLTTRQPTDNSGNYSILFSVYSDSAGTGTRTPCHAAWANNVCTSGSAGCAAYSTNVPTDSWLPCDTTEFVFQLYPDFAIGNLSVAIQQRTDEAILTSNPYQITNVTTPGFGCTIDPTESANGGHASGDCALPGYNASDILVPVAEYATVCSDANDVIVEFAVLEKTSWYDHVFVAGNITQLGNWDPYNAIALEADTSSRYADGSTRWIGKEGIPVGESVEFKYIKWTANGTLVWECEGNRVYTAPTSCGTDKVSGWDGGFQCG